MTRLPCSLLFCAIGALWTVGCNREDVHVSLQPKEPAPLATPVAMAPDPQVSAERPRPKFTWTLPAGWQEAGPGQMSVASFNVKTDAGQATVSITPLPNLAGKEALIINMWREQVGASPLEPAEAMKALTEVEVAGGKGQLFEISGTSGGKPMQIVTAMAQAADASWFYKLSGDESVVREQKPAFLEFLKSVRMQAETPNPTAADSEAVVP